MHVLMKSHTKGIELLNDNEIGCKSNNGAYTGENLYFDSLRMQKYEKYHSLLTFSWHKSNVCLNYIKMRNHRSTNGEKRITLQNANFRYSA